MKIKQHLCGLAVAYPDRRAGEKLDDRQTISRPQGSRYSQQKKLIADSLEYMRRYGQHKPLIFVATSPGFLDLANEQPLISKFTNNLRMTYGVREYVWVRELTENGYPHFHFVCDMPRIEDPVKLSLSWSRYFGSDARNSIRLGTAPDRNGKRQYFINSGRMAFYMSAYFGKCVGDAERRYQRKIRAFGISQGLRASTSPVILEDQITTDIRGFHQREWQFCEDPPDWIESGRKEVADYAWKRCGNHSVFVGVPKDWTGKK